MADAVEQPVQGQDPQSTAPAPAAPPAPVLGDAPWAADLERMIDDPTYRVKVDQYLRETVQPHTTRLEQQLAETKDAVNLLTGLQEEPLDTYVALTTQMFGEEAGEQLLLQLQAQFDSQQPQETSNPQQIAGLDPETAQRLQSVIDYVEGQQVNNHYESEMSRIVDAHPEVDPDLFHPFVGAAGNFDSAYNMYTEWLANYADKHGTPAAPPEQQIAPPVLGSDTQAAQPSDTPTQPRQQTLDQAINDFMAEQRASGAPPVGSI